MSELSLESSSEERSGDYWDRFSPEAEMKETVFSDVITAFNSPNIISNGPWLVPLRASTPRHPTQPT